MRRSLNIVHLLPLLFALAVGFVAMGCEKKEKVVDIETPGGSVEINRSADTGEVDIKITDEK